MATTPSNFSGFPKTLFHFLEDLADNNQRAWFQANKRRYELDLVEPTLQFISAMQQPLKKISPYLTAVPKRMGGSMMRIFRDTRFSKDKSPYKNNVGIHFRHELGADIHAPGLYVHLEPGNSFLGVGLWMPPAPELLKIRQAIADQPQAWLNVRNDKKFGSRYVLEGERLKTAPRGFDKQHPVIEDIKCKSFAALSKIADRDLTAPRALPTIVEAFREARPFMRFLCEALDLPF